MSNHIHQPNVYWRLDEPTIMQLLRHEGWDPVPVNDPAGHVYPPHIHPETKLIAVIHGSIEVKVGDDLYRCMAGDKLVVPGGQEHMAVVGPEGCTFLWSEQLRER